MHLSARRGDEPSGVPPMPISTSTPVLGRAAEIAPAMSPSEMKRIRAPVRADLLDQVARAGAGPGCRRSRRRRSTAWPRRSAAGSRRTGAVMSIRRPRPGRPRASPCRTRPTGRTSRRARPPPAPPSRSACPCSSAWCRRSGRPRRRTRAPSPSPTSSPLNSIGALSFSPSPITTTPRIGDRVDQLAHRVDGGAVAAVLVAPADPAPGGHRRRLGDPDQLEREVAVGRLAPPLGRRGPVPGHGHRRFLPARSATAGPRSPRPDCLRSSQTDAPDGADGGTGHVLTRDERSGAPRCHDGGVSPDPDPDSRPAAEPAPRREPASRPSHRRRSRPCCSRHWSSRRGRR